MLMVCLKHFLIYRKKNMENTIKFNIIKQTLKEVENV